VLVALLLPSSAAAQGDEGVVDVLAHLLAAADARSFDRGLFRTALVAPDAFVRRQAALAAGRIGDSAAVEPLLGALGDSSAAVQAAAAFALGLLRDPRSRRCAPSRAPAMAPRSAKRSARSPRSGAMAGPAACARCWP
jgi:HEAT repeat protein